MKVGDAVALTRGMDYLYNGSGVSNHKVGISDGQDRAFSSAGKVVRINKNNKVGVEWQEEWFDKGIMHRHYGVFDVSTLSKEVDND